jgi:hypothetical protein
MSTDSEKLARLRRFNSWVTRQHTELAEETADVREELFEASPSAETVQRAIDEESIILRRQRPVLTILNNEPQLVFVDRADSEIWKSRLWTKLGRSSSFAGFGHIDRRSVACWLWPRECVPDNLGSFSRGRHRRICDNAEIAADGSRGRVGGCGGVRAGSRVGREKSRLIDRKSLPGNQISPQAEVDSVRVRFAYFPQFTTPLQGFSDRICDTDIRDLAACGNP